MPNFDFFDSIDGYVGRYTSQFRPQSVNPLYKLRSKLIGSWCNHNFVKRCPWDRPNAINRKTLINIYGKIHYSAQHAPRQTQRKWASVDRRFTSKHFPSRCYWKWADKFTPVGWI